MSSILERLRGRQEIEKLSIELSKLRERVDLIDAITSSQIQIGSNAGIKFRELTSSTPVNILKFEWISTDDKMPPNETPVLCKIKDNCPRVLSRELEDDGYEANYSSFWYWDDPSDSGQEIDDDSVTHWMLIPE